MKSLVVLLAAVLLSAADCGASWGQCSGGSCSLTPSVEEWSYTECGPDQVAILRYGRQIGVYRIASGRFYALPDWREQAIGFPVPAQYLAAKRKPCDLRADCKCGCEDGGSCTCAADWRTAGVQTDRLGGSERYSISGQEVTREQALRAAASVPADSKKQRVTFIDSKQAATEFAGNPLASNYVVNSYTSADWQVNGFGFKPGITVQNADGKVVHRQEDYADGAPGLTGALRKADPTYDPAKDPDLRKPVAPAPDPKPGPVVPAPVPAEDLTPHACCVCCLLAAWVYYKKSQGE